MGYLVFIISINIYLLRASYIVSALLTLDVIQIQLLSYGYIVIYDIANHIVIMLPMIAFKFKC